MASARASRLYRLALALAGAGLFAVVAGLVTAAGTASLGVPSFAALAAACKAVVPDDVEPMVLPAAVVGALGVAVLLRGGFSAWRRLRDDRRSRAAFEGPEVRLAGETLTLIADHAPRAFCAGWLRPRIYVSAGTVERLNASELEAVVAHEQHHRRRRDPVRILLLDVLADALFFLPALGVAACRYRALAEVAADEAAVRRSGRERLASALLSFNDAQAPDGAVVGVAPERVDHLLGEPTRWALPMLALLASSLAVTGLLAVAAVLLLAADSPVGSSILVAQSCMAILCPPLAVAGMLVIGASRLRSRF